MPGGDRTGPLGMGSKTGRGLGYCAGYPAPNFIPPGQGYGLGRGRGFGRGLARGMGFGRFFGWRQRGFRGFWEYPYQSFTQEDEVRYLENQAEAIKEELSSIKTRLDELKKAEEKPREK